jgi:hypothetical protein
MQNARTFESFPREVEKLMEVWHTKPIQVRAEFVNLFYEKVVFTVTATHWVHLDIHWRHPAWGTDSVYVHRRRGQMARWTDEEKEIVRQTYATEQKETILQMLPTKTWKAIREQANDLGLVRDLAMRERLGIPVNLAWTDIEFMRREGLTDRKPFCLSPSQREKEACAHRGPPACHKSARLWSK